MKCKYCDGDCKKKGVKNGNQSFQCKKCGKYQKSIYKNQAYRIPNETIISCVKEGLGIRSTARLLGISSGTVIRRIRCIAASINKPPIALRKSFEIDELFTFIHNKIRDSVSYWHWRLRREELWIFM